MKLPLMLQMEIDISAAAHKREVAEGFATLRKKLIPPEPERRGNPYDAYLQDALLNMGMNGGNPYRVGLGAQAVGWPHTVVGGLFGLLQYV